MKTSTKINNYLASVNIKNSKYYDNLNSLIVSKIKNETCGRTIKGFVGLKSKIYTFITGDNH